MTDEDKMKEAVSLATIARDIHYIQKGMDEMKKDFTTSIDNLRDDLSEKYLTKEAYEPVRKLVYGVTALMLAAVIGAVVTLVIK